MKIINNISNLLYRIIKPKGASKLACSPLGRIVSKILSLNKKEMDIYQTSVQGIKLELSRDEASTSGIMHLGLLNPFETRWLEGHLNRGDVFLDIGAYVDGWYTLLASKLVGKKGKIYSFEPHPDFCKRLKRNIKINKLNNITVAQLAMSNKSGFSFLSDNRHLSSLAIDKKESHTSTIKVKTMTVDAYVKRNNIEKIDVIKLDVEGFETEVLKGAKKTLKSMAPALLVEIDDRLLRNASSSRQELIKLLKNLGYDSYIFTMKGLKPGHKDSQTMNVVFSKNPVTLNTKNIT